jgi:GrpB-like predicted nucleotidyltransferase (UPF0157 family)
MSLALPDVHGPRLDADADARARVALLAPAHYQDVAVAAYEDAELLLTAILPDTRVEHVGASAVAGAHSRGGVDICVAVPRDAFDESLAVLCEAGYVKTSPHAHDPGRDRQAALAAPHARVPLTLRLVESGSAHEALMRFRDALRADAALLARYDAIRIEAGALGAAAYAGAKARFIAAALDA